jgi:L-2-hydroxyglutarate oxidase
MKEVAVIGGGILGLAISYQLSLTKKYKVSLFEKETAVGKHQSGNNSGVLHCGLYYQPGSLKAKLAVEGIREMVSFCEKHQVNHEICGKIVVASDEREENFLTNLADRGEKNGLKGLKYLTDSELKVREPHVKAKKALLVPEEGIVDFKQVMTTLSDQIKLNNGEIFLGQPVISCKKLPSGKTIVNTSNLEKEFDLVVSCSGLFSDRNFKNFTNKKSPIKIVPFRGEYLHIADEYKHLVNHLIYPVPDPQYPFLGVHFTKMINGAREVGPNAVLALKREGYKNTDFSLADTLDTLTYKGFLNFLTKNFTFAIGEFKSSINRNEFIRRAKKLIPEAEDYMFKSGGTAGVRAQALDENGELIMDFKIERFDNQIHVLNAPSPGATASLAIAKYIIENYIND